MWDQLIFYFGGGTILIGVVAWLTKSILSHFLSKDIENYKLNLKAETDQNIERFRTSLRMAAFEHEVRFSRLHEKRAEVIAELYKKLVDAVSATESFVSLAEWAGEPSKGEKYKVSMEKIVGFFRYFDRRRIFLSEVLCEQLDGFVDEIRKPAIEFSVYLDLPDYDVSSVKEKRDVWVEAWRSVSKESVPIARKALETHFRQILGANDSARKSGIID